MTGSKIRPDAFLKACPSREVMARLGEKWTMLMIVALEDGPLRFSALKRKLEGISHKMLTQTARNLERDGLVIRRLIDERPLHVEYELTESESDLLPIVRKLKNWAESHLHGMAAHARSYDQKHTPGS